VRGASARRARTSPTAHSRSRSATRSSARPADVQRGGATYAVLELTREFLVERTGELRIPAPSARFACATRFEQDFFLESQPVDWQLARANGSELVLRVEPLPAAGRPTSFTGAVGRFSVRSETDAPEVDLRESLTVRLIVEGHGNTEFFDAPRLDRLHGFEVRGVLDGKSPTQRTLSYDLAVASPAVTEVPALEFAYFDPGELPSYRVLRTEPLPLSVRSSPMEPVGLGPSLEARGRVVELLVVAAILALLVVASAVFAWRKLQRRKREASQVP
jgi:hypothetical protein